MWLQHRRLTMFTGPDAIGDRAGNAAYARGDRYDAFTRDDWPKLTEAEQTALPAPAPTTDDTETQS